MNIGQEVNKGAREVRAVAVLLAASEQLNYVGHVEGDGLFRGEADVVVCDGFVGNVLLKASEGVAGYLQAEMRDAIEASRLLLCVSATILVGITAPVCWVCVAW